MPREFICPYCCTLYTGTLPLGAVTTCDNCCERFSVLPFHGDQNGVLRMIGGWVAEAFAGKKCPGCRTWLHRASVPHGHGRRLRE
jgi:hypothetical protein